MVGNPPEFLYVADIVLAARVGIRLFWNYDQGHGDPAFPDFSQAALRSVTEAGDGDYIYPKIAGSLLVGLDAGTDLDAVKDETDASGTQNIQQMATGSYVWSI